VNSYLQILRDARKASWPLIAQKISAGEWIELSQVKLMNEYILYCLLFIFQGLDLHQQKISTWEWTELSQVNSMPYVAWVMWAAFLYIVCSLVTTCITPASPSPGIHLVDLV
jgi:hypothetical protein